MSLCVQSVHAAHAKPFHACFCHHLPKNQHWCHCFAMISVTLFGQHRHLFSTYQAINLIVFLIKKHGPVPYKALVDLRFEI
ncbi:hypothetical protein AMECASPLE_020675 [Ameca splendens]|uniref:Uncharacterized protein n=1 Tax=Ameca splendens TaxID=208324 RepID=A0ABV0Z1E5_9TELE